MTPAPGPAGALPDRCAARSLEAGESLHASAPSARRWLLLEFPGSWGPRPPAGCGLDDRVVRHLATATAAGGLRLQLIRRHRRARDHAAPPAGGPRRFFLADVDPRRRLLLAGTWHDQSDLLDLPLDALAGEDRPGAPAAGLETWPDPLVLVCTHAKRDACCALYGRRAAAELQRRYGERVWETTHTGGHRFAPNVVVLPDGAVLGRVDGGRAPAAVAAVLAGAVPVESFRGWAFQDDWSQAAEWFARTRLGLRARDDVEPVACRVDGDTARVVVRTTLGRYRLALVRRACEPRPLSCAGAAQDPGEIALAAFEAEEASGRAARAGRRPRPA